MSGDDSTEVRPAQASPPGEGVGLRHGHGAPEYKAHMEPQPIIEGHVEVVPATPPPPPPRPAPGVENIARPVPAPQPTSDDG